MQGDAPELVEKMYVDFVKVQRVFCKIDIHKVWGFFYKISILGWWVDFTKVQGFSSSMLKSRAAGRLGAARPSFGPMRL